MKKLLLLIVLISFSTLAQQAVVIDVNKLKLPIDNSGRIGHIEGYSSFINYDESQVLFSAGFFLSGFKNQSLMWANGIDESWRSVDYRPGKVGMDPNDFRNVVYVVKHSDPPFSASWYKWKHAVELGAEFYDGNNDGIYTPFDINNNGLWDRSEDKPLLIGDITAWSVYNDGVPANERVMSDVHPLGIEIQQTIFGSHNNDAMTNNILFIRYKIINKSLTHESQDSVYFSFKIDSDIGDPYDDLCGSDTLLQSGFTYNDGFDNIYGNQPPAFFMTLLQGPKQYIPGITFTDVNGNGTYDHGIDIPLDTAIIKRGPDLGVIEYPGAGEVGFSYFSHVNFSPHVDPGLNRNEVRRHQKAETWLWAPIDPCTWEEGEVIGVNCAEVSNRYFYSGDPVTRIGWLDSTQTDRRMFITMGPFNMKDGEEVEIMGAYVAGRGMNALNSITFARANVEHAFDMYNSNFTQLPVYEDGPGTPYKFRLYQNYPNPFNPSTVIRFTVGGAERTSHAVTLKVFDMLGREIAELVNGNKFAGDYEVNFNSTNYNLAAGVYFYRITLDQYTYIRKMVILK